MCCWQKKCLNPTSFVHHLQKLPLGPWEVSSVCGATVTWNPTTEILEIVWEEGGTWGRVRGSELMGKERSKTCKGHKNRKSSVDDNVYSNIFNWTSIQCIQAGKIHFASCNAIQ